MATISWMAANAACPGSFGRTLWAWPPVVAAAPWCGLGECMEWAVCADAIAGVSRMATGSRNLIIGQPDSCWFIAACQIIGFPDMISIMSGNIVELLQSMGGRERSLVEGEFLFHQGDPVTAFFVVRDGLIHLVRHQEDGRAIVLQRAGPGGILAEASLFSERYHCDAVAATSARVHGVPKQPLRRRFRNDPDFAEEWAAHLAREIQEARFRSEVLALRTVAARLDAWRAWYGAFPPKGEWRHFAEQIGVSPEALYRELARRRK
jgi:CRP-like cAMP-binding protein